ncbi:GH3 auxin-responsive promoter family protein [Verrucomicrobia bacterium]|nr:GH3 auxin-responsive promoter family protein [Verrucomicrobiota bacterium]
MNSLGERWLNLQMPEHGRFLSACSRVGEVQTARLKALVRANAETAFGQAHDFSDIRTPADFADQVPVGDHATNVQPWLDRMGSPEDGQLTKQPVRFFEQTSGTTGAVKLIPFTSTLRSEISRAVAAWMGGLNLELPDAFAGPAYWAISPPLMNSHPPVAGVSVGHLEDTAYFPPRAARALSDWLVMDQAVQAETAEAFYGHTLDRLLACRDLSFVSVWSPTFFLNLDRLLQERLGHDFIWSDLWPGLALLSCWTDAQSAQWTDEVEERLGPGVKIQGKGLMASEGVTSVPYPGGSPVLAVCSHFYEFLDQETSAVRFAHELSVGSRYEVVLTTGGGLYRYLTRDLVEVTGHLEQAPRLRFVGRTGRSVDLVGEKLSEPQVIKALAGTRGFLVPRTTPTGYLLCVEDPGTQTEGDALASRTEVALSANPYYEQACRLGQLYPLSLHRLPDGFTANLGRKWAARQGLRDSEVKLPALFQPGEVDDLLPVR